MITNRQKLDKIGNKELAKKIKSLSMLPGFEYIDWEAWLKSEDPEFPYIGEMCHFKPYEETFAPCNWMSGIMVDTKIIAGSEYKLIISQGTMYNIPTNRVKAIDVLD